jgi:hypothetical protein
VCATILRAAVQFGEVIDGADQPAVGQVDARRSQPPRTASIKSTWTNVIGRIRHSVKTEPSMLQYRNVLCRKDVPVQ